MSGNSTATRQQDGTESAVPQAAAGESCDVVRRAVAALARGESLRRADAEELMHRIMDGALSGAQFGAVVMGLLVKGETVEEIAGLAAVMRARAVPVLVDGPVLDTCGTGGDGSDSFNVSTVAAFVAAAAGARVAKHGNRAASSACGSADVLEALGAAVQLPAGAVSQVLQQTGVGFMFAPLHHPAMRHAAAYRRELRVRTVFNLLGPLTNPAGARHQVIGVADATLVPTIAAVLRELGSSHALVVHGRDGLDELSVSAPTLVCELRDGSLREYEVDPRLLGLGPAPAGSLTGGGPKTNARIARSVLEGERGPRRDVVVLNAAAGLVAADLAGDLGEAVHLARCAIDDGGALDRLDRFVRATRAAAGGEGVAE